MIPRYQRPEMANIWSEQNRYRIWFDIELYALEAFEKLSIAPTGAAAKIRQRVAEKNSGKFDVERILEIEQVTKHDVIAFLTAVNEIAGEESRFLHLGMTSSDVLDTCLSLQLKQSSELLVKDLKQLLTTLKSQALKYKNTACAARSHGIHAEPTTFGLKLARFYAEFERNLNRLQIAQQEISVCAISGAVGTFATVDPSVQTYVAKKLGLSEETISSQIIPRDRHAFFFTTLGVIASSIENIAVEIRHLQRSEVLEAEEFFSSGQKGSSAMPHKRNPVLSENLTGLARIVRSAVTPMLENVALWHERDISHSAVERTIVPDALVVLDFALVRLNGLVQNLIVHEKNMARNLAKLNGLVFSQRALLVIIEEAKLSREQAYQVVQRNAMKVWDNINNEDGKLQLLELLKKDVDLIGKISVQKLEQIFDLSYYTKHVDTIYAKVFSKHHK